MAHRELQTILNSGELTQAFFGGTTSLKKVQIKEDMTATNISYDDTGAGITAASVQAALAILAEVGIVVLSGKNLTPQSIPTSPTKVLAFDAKIVEEGVGATGSVIDQQAIATLDGVFKIRFEQFVSYASNIDITWELYKNGVTTGESITLSGKGATVFQIILLTSSPLLANDYLELFATSSATADITIISSNGTLEKTIF